LRGNRSANADSELERFCHPPAPLVLVDALHFQAERYVLGGRHVRKERIALENDAEAALIGLDG
jgi:hypothetical protein